MSPTPDDPGRPDRPPDDPDIPTGTGGDEDFDESAYDQAGPRRFLSGRRLVAAAIAVALLGVGAAFVLGSGSGDVDEPASGDDGGRDEALADAALEYAECMRENGLEEWPDPVIDDDGGVDMDSGELYDMDMPEVQAADEVCQPILEEVEDAPGPGPTPEELAELQDQTLAMAQCMRDRGWDFPDPEVSTEGGAVGIVVEGSLPQEGDSDFEQFRQDHEDCSEEAGMPTEEDEGDEGDGGG